MGDDSSDSWLGEFCQQPQHLPLHAAGSREGVMLQGNGAFLAGSLGLRVPGAAEGVVWSEQAGASPSLPPCASSCMETRAHPFGAWSSLMHRALYSCARSLMVASNAPSLTGIFRLLSLPVGLWVLLRFLSRCPWGRNVTASSNGSKPLRWWWRQTQSWGQTESWGVLSLDRPL